MAVFTTRARACVQPHSYARCFTLVKMSWSGSGVCDRVVGVVMRVAGRGEEYCVDGGFRMCRRACAKPEDRRVSQARGSDLALRLKC